MTPQRWNRVKELFHAALSCEVDERQAFLAQRCADDPELQREVMALVVEHERTGRFMDSTAGGFATAPRDNVPDLSGQQISHYQIEHAIGQGGMGTVYLARDTRLERNVALKFLPPQAISRASIEPTAGGCDVDDSRLRRFRREARAASMLNHPNIVTVHEIGQFEDCHFLVTEWIDGQTLEDRVDGHPLDCDDVVDIAAQIAAALDEAHSAGMIHRDIKSANIMVNRRGQVKILDFGLAKAISSAEMEASAGIGNDYACSARHGIGFSGHTAEGAIIGTVPFMSPEQARGQTLDHRSDLFSLGVVMYHMTTGRLPFSGKTAFETLHQVCTHEPAAISTINRQVPEALERIIVRCLRKPSGQRYQSAGALWRDLETLVVQRSAANSALGPATRSASRPLPRIVHHSKSKPILGGLSVAIAVLAIVLAGESAGQLASQLTNETVQPNTSPPAAAQTVPLRRPFVQLTHGAGEELFPSLSPDGTFFLYASRAAGKWDIYRQPIGSDNARNLTGNIAGSYVHPAVSPDGQQVAFSTPHEGGIFIMATDSGPIRQVSNIGYNPSWSPAGDEIVYATKGTRAPDSRSPGELWAVHITSGATRKIAEKDATQPHWSPRGHRIAYWGLHQGNGRRDIWTVPATGGKPVPVTDDEYLDWNPVWSPDGKYLYFASDRGGAMNLWRVAIDERSGRVTGAPEHVSTPSAYAAHISFSADSKQVAYAHIASSRNVQRVALDPETATVIGEPQWITRGSVRITWPHLSADGQWLAVTASSDVQQEDLFILRADGTDWQQLTDDIYKDRTPRWSPDGQRIIFYSDRSGKYEVWAINRDGSGLQQITYTAGADVYYPLWSPDGARLLFQHRDDGKFIIDSHKPWAEQSPIRLPQDGVEAFTPWSWSPDGRQLAGGLRWPNQATPDLAMYSLDTQQYQSIFTRSYFKSPVWLQDSRRLLFSDNSAIYLVDSQSSQVRQILSVAPDRAKTLTLSSDNRQLYFSRITEEADIWLAAVP